ncbi:hypothetical protein OAM67_00570, partial [bacterium]|nr:hypothetical protein [bacterium]
MASDDKTNCQLLLNTKWSCVVPHVLVSFLLCPENKKKVLTAVKAQQDDVCCLTIRAPGSRIILFGPQTVHRCEFPPLANDNTAFKEFYLKRLRLTDVFLFLRSMPIHEGKVRCPHLSGQLMHAEDAEDAMVLRQ